VGDVENNFEEVCVLRRDIPELSPTTELIPCKLDLVLGTESLGDGFGEGDTRCLRVSSRCGSCLIGNKPIVSISGEVDDGDGECLLIWETMNVTGHVSNPGVWGRLAVEGRCFVLLWYEE
jgi:hypothetical protein